MVDAAQLNAQLMQQQQAAAGGKPGFLGPIPMTWDVTGGFKLGTAGLNLSERTIVKPLTFGKAGGMADKFHASCVAQLDEIKQKCAQAGVIHSGTGNIHTSNGAPPIGGGSSFASNLSSAMSGMLDSILGR